MKKYIKHKGIILREGDVILLDEKELYETPVKKILIITNFLEFNAFNAIPLYCDAYKIALKQNFSIGDFLSCTFYQKELKTFYIFTTKYRVLLTEKVL